MLVDHVQCRLYVISANTVIVLFAKMDILHAYCLLIIVSLF